nr:hypothetical protein [Tanacetum cinerariifolium]
MDEPNITMEEYIRLEEEKAHRRDKYGKIWYDEDIHDLRSVDTEFPAITFNDEVSSEKTLSYGPTEEREPPLRFRALVMTIGLDLPRQILNAQTKARKPKNIKKEDVGGITVYTTYSLNEYNVFDTRINTTYPGDLVKRNRQVGWRIYKSGSVGFLKFQDDCSTHDLAQKFNVENPPRKHQGIIMEYLVNISKRRAFWSLNDDILKITVLTTNTPYPLRRYDISVLALTKDHEGNMINTPYPEKTNTPYWRY